ncbi:MAG: hypothetical protein ACI815_000639, partial [Psychroserpens sp.]
NLSHGVFFNSKAHFKVVLFPTKVLLCQFISIFFEFDL